MSKPIFYEGQAVGCLICGEGEVLEIKESMVTVRFKDGVDDYFPNGSWLEHQRPTLYPLSQYRQIIANLPAPQPEAWKPKPGEWCCLWDNKEHFFVVAKYAKNHADQYDNCAPFVGELPDHLKEVQP